MTRISAFYFLLQFKVQRLQAFDGLPQFKYVPGQGQILLPKGIDLSFTISDVMYTLEI